MSFVASWKCVYFFPALTFAHGARCAAAIFRRADADTVRLGFPGFVLAFPDARFAQRTFCAMLIFLRAAADIVRVPFDFADPPYAPTKAVSAAFSADNWFCTRSRSFFNCSRIIPDRFAMFVCSPR